VKLSQEVNFGPIR